MIKVWSLTIKLMIKDDYIDEIKVIFLSEISPSHPVVS